MAESTSGDESIRFLFCEGESARLIREADWTLTALGPPDGWCVALKTIVGLMLASKQPMYIAWGVERTLLYNDSYAPLLGRKHPAALGKPFFTVWPETIDTIEPMIDRVFNGESIFKSNIRLELNRRGGTEEAHFSFSFTPIRDERNVVAGLFCVCNETTEEVLLQQEESREMQRLSRLFEQAPSFMALMCGPEHRIDLVNAAYQKIVGRDVVGKTVAECIPEAVEQGYVALLDQVFRSGEPFLSTGARFVLSPNPDRPAAHEPNDEPNDLAHAPLDERFYDFIFQPAFNSKGVVTGIFVEGSDVTERMRSEAALRKSEERYRMLLDSVPVAVLICDRHGVLQSYNRRTIALWGCIPALLGIGSHYCESTRLFLPDGTRVTAGNDPITEAICSGAPIINCEMLIERPDGSRIPVSANFSALTNKDGVIDGAIATFDEITELKQAQADARRADARFRFMSEFMPQKIFTATPSGDVDYFNRQWTDYTGLTMEQLCGWRWEETIHPDDLEENLRVWRQAVETGERFKFEHRLKNANGEYRWHCSRAKAIRDDLGQITMWLGANTDIHEIKIADQRKSEFLAMLAHELRNPLAPISYTVEILNQLHQNDSATQQSLKVIERQLRQVTRLIDDLLDVSRISRGMLTLQRERIELAPLLRQVIEAVGPGMKVARHALTVVLPPEPIFVEGDGARLIQVFGNILDNACKFTPPQGSIVLTARRDGEDVIVSVKDSGIGIETSSLSGIFEMFEQGEQSPERARSGLGIGLALARRMVEMHRGEIRATSSGAGTGSEFVVRLPMLVDHDAETHKGNREQEVDVAPQIKRILVVDDNRDAAISLAFLLQTTGYQTFVAYDGVEAIETAQALRPDVILLDIGLPRLNGYEVAAQLRKTALGPDVTLVAVTGWGQKEDRQKSREAGFDGHLVKPVVYADLMNLLAALTREENADRLHSAQTTRAAGGARASQSTQAAGHLPTG